MIHEPPCHDILEAETVEEDLRTPFDEGMRLLNKHAFKQETQLQYPVVIGIELVEGCNLSCNMCFQRSRTKPINYHDVDELKGLFQQLEDAKPLKVYLTGGEPTIHPSFVDVLELFADGSYELTLFTNATLMEQDLVDEIAHLSDDVSIQVSFDAVGDAHEDIRGVAVEKVMGGAKRLLDAGFEVHTRTTIQPNNVDLMEEIYEACVEMDVDYADFSPILPTFGWDNIEGVSESYLEFQEEAVENFAELVSERDSFPVPITQDPVAVPFGFDGVSKDVVPDAYLCPAGNIALEVDSVGEVYPCPYLHYEEFSAGNVYEEDLIDIWQGVKSGDTENEKWNGLIDYKNMDHSTCQSCEMSEHCKGACPAAGYHYFGDLDAPDFRCQKILKDEAARDNPNRQEPQSDTYVY